jgi:phage terminase small subunit
LLARALPAISWCRAQNCPMPTAKHRPLSLREEAFAREYASCGDGKRAAIAAGYGRAGAAVQAHRCLKRPAVRALVRRAVAAREKAVLDAIVASALQAAEERAVAARQAPGRC